MKQPGPITKNPLVLMFLSFLLNACIVGPVTWIINRHIENFDDFKQRTIQKIDTLNEHVQDINKALRDGYLRRSEFYKNERELQQRVRTLESRIYEISNKHR